MYNNNAHTQNNIVSTTHSHALTLTHSVTHSQLVHSLSYTHARTHTHSVTHSVTQSVSHSLSQSVTHSLSHSISHSQIGTRTRTHTHTHAHSLRPQQIANMHKSPTSPLWNPSKMTKMQILISLPHCCICCRSDSRFERFSARAFFSYI